MENQPKEVIMPFELYAALMRYLGQQPHDGVNPIIVAIQQQARPYVAPTEPTIAETPITKP